MNEFNAWKAFQAATGAPSSIEDDYRRMLEAEATDVTRNGKRVKWSDAVEVAAARILEWWNTADQVKASADRIIARSRIARAWAVLASHQHAVD